MAKRILLLVNIFIILLLQVGFCSTSEGAARLTDMRWANHTDSVTGAGYVRLVVDSSSAVDIDSAYSESDGPRIVLRMKNAQLSAKLKDAALNNKVIDKVSFKNVDAKTVQMTIQLPAKLQKGDYKVFSLAANAKAKRPFRIVIDVKSPVPAAAAATSAAHSYSAGLKGKVIILDPGHGGSDPGAIGPTRIREKDVTLEAALKLRSILENAGAKVVMTREDDRDVYAPNDTALEELSARANVARRNDADVFVSLHANAFNDPSARGTATYYYAKTSLDAMLADDIHSAVMNNINLQDRGTNEANFYVIKHAGVPAVLLEMAFITNSREEKLLASASFQEQIANGVAAGLDNFFLHASQQGGGR